MSYQGYLRQLCANGHLTESDAYDLMPPAPCSCCRTEFVWREMVDTTSGEGEPTSLVEAGNEEVPCYCCGGTGKRLVTRYAIPEKLR